ASQRNRRGRGRREELASVHGTVTGSAGGQVPALEQPLDLVLQRAFDVDELVRQRAGALEQRAILPQVREAKVGQTGLSRAEQLATAADVEVDLRELEAVGRADQRFQPC